MCGNFWKSSHYEQWLFEKADLLRERGEDLKVFNEEEYQKIMIFFINFIQEIGKDPSIKLHMQAISTACVYFRRFYARRSFKDIDPFLLAPTCILLATKVEESGLDVKTTTKLPGAVLNALKNWSYLSQSLTIKPQQLQEAEFYMLEIFDCSLVIYHPYRSLSQLVKDMKSSLINNVDQLYQDAWRVCNDSLRSDVSLLFPPYLIALSAVMVAGILNNRKKELEGWLSELNVDFEKVFEIQQMIFSMYKVWKSFDEPTQLFALMEKLPRPRN